MKGWSETTAVLERIEALAASGQPGALATVVGIDGSAYRRPGAKLLVAANGVCVGGVSGGCLEADVREVAASVMRGDPPRLLRYDMRGEDGVLALGLGCNGAVDVFVQPAVSADAGTRDRIRGLLAGDLPFGISTVVRGPGLGQVMVHEIDGRVTGSSGDAVLDRELTARVRMALDRRESELAEVPPALVFNEILAPPPHLLIFGAGDDAIPLAAAAGQVGFRVCVVDHRPAALDPARFPRGTRLAMRRPEDGLEGLPVREDAFVVMKMHSLVHDRAWLGQVLAAPVGYIGVLGPRARTTGMLRHLGVAETERVYGPVGLDLGAEGPEQVAIAIVAELLSVRSGRVPEHLRGRGGAIHAA